MARARRSAEPDKFETLYYLLGKLGRGETTVAAYREAAATHHITEDDEVAFCERASRIVVLESRHLRFADETALRRLQTQTGKQRKPGVDSEFDAALALAVRQIRIEAAAKLFLNPVQWRTSGKGPALHDFIEVRERGDKRPRVDAARAYLMVCAKHHPRYEMVEWSWGDDNAVHHPHDLADLLRNEQARA